MGVGLVDRLQLVIRFRQAPAPPAPPPPLALPSCSCVLLLHPAYVARLLLCVQPDVLLNYSGKSLEALLSGRAALALSATVKLSFLVNGLLSLPMYLFPYQASRCYGCCVCASWCMLAGSGVPPCCRLVCEHAAPAAHCLDNHTAACYLLCPAPPRPACLQRNLWSALPNQSADDRMSNKRSFALTNIVSLAGELVPAGTLPCRLPAFPAGFQPSPRAMHASQRASSSFLRTDSCAWLPPCRLRGGGDGGALHLEAP